MTAIFISHSSHDAAEAAEVSAWLVSQGHRSFFLDFDPEFGIPAGRSWEQELYHQLRACRAVIVLCSRASMASKWCFSEITQARSLGKVLLPVRIDDCTVDGVLSSRQVIDLGEDRAEAFERLRRGLLAAGVDPTKMFDWDNSRAPYPGLLAFQEQDAAVYFGRDKEIGGGLDLLNRIRRLGSPRVVVVVGASGSGKSSLVRAGLAPRLRRDPDRWMVVGPFRPRDDPVAELAAVWSHAFDEVGDARGRGELAAMLRDAVEHRSPANPLITMSDELRRAGRRSDATVLLVVDQFEELVDPTSLDAPAVLHWLRNAAEATRSPLIVLATLRSDFLGAIQKTAELAELECELMPVGPMSVEDVTQVIEGPASVAGLDLGSGLVQAMLADSDADDGLPLLAFTLREMYDQFGGDGRLDVAEYRELGGLHGALARVAHDVVDSQHLTTEQEHELRKAFLAMARLADDDRWVRQVARWDQLPVSIHPVLEKFVTARLLVSSGDPGARTVEVAHEALFRSWDRLAEWLQRDAEAFRLRRDLENAAAAWIDGGQQPTDLWRGARLDRAAELTRSGDLHLGPTDQHFIDVALEARGAELAQQDRARRRKLRIAAAVAAGALALAGVAIAFFVQAQRESDRATRQAERSATLALAAQSTNVAAQNPALALVLAAEAVRTTDPPLAQAMHALFDVRTTFAARSLQQIRGPLSNFEGAWELAFSPDSTLLATGRQDGTVALWDRATGQPVGEPLEGHNGPVYGVAISPDGTLLAAATREETVMLWDLATGQRAGQALEGHSSYVNAVAFSPDGTVLASASDDGTVRLWDVATGQPVGQPLQGHNGAVNDVAFSPDGALLASGGDDWTVRLWDPATGEPVGQPLPVEYGADDVAFSPDGRMLASAGGDFTVRLWDPATGQQVGEPLQGHTSIVKAVAFSPDGSLLASSGWDKTVRLWDPATGQPVGQPLQGHAGEVNTVAFSPDGELLATGDSDAVLLWDAAPGSRVGQPLEGHESPVYDVAFSPDGTLLASASGGDGMVRLWDSATGRPVGQPLEDGGFLKEVAFNPDGTLLASASDDGTVRFWDPATSQPAGQPLQGEGIAVTTVEFSPDGTLLATVDDEAVRVWNVTTRQPVGQRLRLDGDSATTVAFSPDGRLLASGSYAGDVLLWDVTTGKRVGEPLKGHTNFVNGLAFSPDGTLLAAANGDGTVQLWKAATGEPTGQALTGHSDQVVAVAFSPDGTLLASASWDFTVRLWDPATGQPVGQPLQGHTAAVEAVAFSPDGKRLASGGQDMTVMLWDAPWDVDRACALAEPYVTAAQVRPFLAPGREPTACELHS